MKDLNTQLEVANTIYGELVSRLDLFASVEANAPIVALIEKQLDKIGRIERTIAVRAEAKAMRQAMRGAA